MPTYANGGIARSIAVRSENNRRPVLAEYGVPDSDAEKWAQGTAP